ncbi:hypothetical protein [Ramlibacter sp. AN1133]|uniref:hypothetical protein n=1 Tax=Ramlibacter sp. AN1133 TaxID=3133429 RepID=UPI0030C1D641
MAEDVVLYLNRPPAWQHLSGGLVKALEDLPAKLQKAPAIQWVATVKSLVSKGAAKQAEVDDCELVKWLEDPLLGEKRPVTREDLITRVKERQVTLKEVTLGNPRYESWSHMGLVRNDRTARYAEVLFIANDQKANIQDRLEAIEWEMDQFNFDLERLSSNPEAVLQLEKERRQLLTDLPKAWEYKAPHFTESAGRHGKNLLAHGRELVWGDTYLIEEVQSDWGQRGRINDWKTIPRGPFVTDTKLWAGLVVRRMLQRAAMIPQVKKVAWIRGSMRNGGKQVQEDNLDDFYLKVVRSIVDKAIAKGNGKTAIANLRLGDTVCADVPCFEMTDSVREQLRGTQPMYSLTSVRHEPHVFTDDRRAAFFARAKHMLGSVKHVMLVDRLYDIATGRAVPGRLVNRVMQIALNAEDPEFVLDHECFHYAMRNLFIESERHVVLREFVPGSELNRRTYDTLVERGEKDASAQCLASAEEAAAHGFALWARGTLDMGQSPARGFFEEVRVLFCDLVAWFNRTIQQEQCTTSEDVFKALLNGERAHREDGVQRWRQAA